MASRAEQKAQARAAREERQRHLAAARQRRQRYTYLGGMLVVVIAAVVIAIVVSSGGGKASNPAKVSKSQQSQVQSEVNALLAGIPQHLNVLGNPKAPVTVTEFGDLVCPICADFANSSEPELISAEVKTGKVRLVYRGSETASGYANGSEYVNTQVAARSAGLQDKEWQFILTTYAEQPSTIDGQAAEDVAYVNTAYLQNRASQVTGLNLADWQANLTNKTLIADVSADRAAATAAGVTGTPAIIVSGPKGSQFYNKSNNASISAVPSLQQLQQLIAQVS